MGEIHLEHEPYKKENNDKKSNSLTSASTSNKKKIDYQRDVALESSALDEFKHSHYVNVLIDILTKAETPINIGLYGRWGVGKSSTLNMLKEKLQEKPYSKNFKYLYVNAWGLSADSLKQEVLVSINNELGSSSPFKPQVIEDELYNVREEGIADFNEVFRRGWPFFAIMIGGVATGIVLHVNSVIDFSNTIIISAVISLIAAIAKFLPERSKRIIPRAASSHQFNKIYNKMIERQNKKLVVVIDNLDRCDAEVAVSLLGLIQTFMTKEKCINILACDDEAIVHHLAKVKGGYYTEREGNEFLSKFFQVTIRIPPFIGENLQVYVEKLMEQRTIPLSMSVKHILISGAIKNPRKVNQFLNNVVAMYRLAEHKENSKKIRAGIITKNIAFLTKIIVVRHEWPHFYKLLEKNSRLLDQINKNINEKNPISLIPPENKLATEEWINEGISEFLIATQFCTVPDVKPFLRLNQESFEGELADIDRFQVAVERYNVNYILEKIKKAKDNEKEKYIKKICLINDGYSNDNAVAPLLITTKVLIKSLEIIENESIKETGLLNLGRCILPILKENYHEYDLVPLFTLVKQMKSYFHEQVYQIFTELIVQGEDLPNLKIIKELLKDDVGISRNVIDGFDKKLSEILMKHETDILDVIGEICSSNDWRTTSLRRPAKFIKTLIEGITFDASEIDNQRLDIYSKIKPSLDKSEKEFFINHLHDPVSKFLEAPAKPPPSPRIFETINEIDFTEYSNMDLVIGKLFGILVEASKQNIDVNLRKTIFEVLIKLKAQFGESSR